MKANEIIKKLFFVAGCAALVCAVNVNDSHAASATSSAKGTVITPIAVSNTAALNFGTFASGASAGTIELSSAGVPLAGGGVMQTAKMLEGDTPAAASFHVTGQGSLTFAITVPSAAVSLSGSGGGTMSVDTFVASATTGTLTAGAADFTVGATLHASANQTPGTYTGTFDVTVDYN